MNDIKLRDYQQSAIEALNEMTADEIKELMTSEIRTVAVDIEAEPFPGANRQAMAYVTQDAYETIYAYNPALAKGLTILGTGGHGMGSLQLIGRNEFNNRRFTVIIDEAIKDAAKIDAEKSNDIRREAKRLRQAEAKLARQRQIRANGGRR